MTRASTYDPDVSVVICERLADGEPLAAICRSLGIGRTTVYDWQREQADFAERIARAREAGFDRIAEDCLEIADDGRGDSYEDDEGNVRTNPEVVQRSKLRVETRLKLLAKWDPRRYGERTTTEVTGANGGPVQVNDGDMAAKLAAILASAQARKAADAD